MRKRIKLRWEILLFIFLSIIISSIITVIITNVINLVFKNKEFDYTTILKESKLSYVIDEFKNKNITEEELVKIVNNWGDKYLNIYMIDNNGKVLASREKGIKCIDLDDVNKSNITKLEGKNAVEISSKIDLNNERAIVYYCNYYSDDSKEVFIMFSLWILIFIIFIHSRISYISKIDNSITDISKGEFSKRIELKYNNELRSLAENVNAMAQRLQEEDDRKKEFITNISHDLRTPLTTMLGYLNIIEEDKYDSKEELKSYVKVMKNKGKYLESLLNDFFSYSKLSSKDVKLSCCDINCKLFLEQILLEEKSYFARKNLNLDFNCKEGEYIINADSELVVRAFYNLLTNAYKYSKENSTININIDKENRNNKSYTCISVLNEPENDISEDNINILFERLYKGSYERNSKGSGLGLTITKEIMNLHNGFIEARMIDKSIEFKLGFLN